MPRGLSVDGAVVEPNRCLHIQPREEFLGVKMNTSLKLIHTWLAIVTIGLLQLAYASNASAQVAYTNNFEGAVGSEWTDSTTALSNGENFLAPAAVGAPAGTNTLSLTGLSTHTSVTVTFDLYIIQSMDGNGPQGGGADNWELTADGGVVFRSNFANFEGGNTQAYPAQLPPIGAGASNPPRTGQIAADHLGFGTGEFGDATYRISVTFPHTGATLNLGFTSAQNQPTSDEGWGLDNVVVSLDAGGSSTAIPTMSAYGLVLTMLGLLLVAARRLRASAKLK